jgi:hypothetical protein
MRLLALRFADFALNRFGRVHLCLQI